jgi:signal transduction histidine kinase/DNA-binding response OmpR family regulator
MILGRPAPPGHVALVHHRAQRAQELALQLRASGHRVSLVAPGRRAAQAVIDLAPDLLIGPLVLADPAFGAIVRRVREALGPDLPVLALLADDDPQGLVEADDVAREPIDPGELDLRVGSILRARIERRTLQRKVQDLLGLYKLSWAFSLAGGPEAVYGHLARHSAEILKAEKAMVALFDLERRQIVGQSPAHGFTREQVEAVRYSVDEARQRWNFRTNGPLIANHPRADSRVLPELVARLDLHSLMLAPLIGVGKGAFHGALLVADRLGGGGFSEDDLSLLCAIAGQATVAVENLKLHGEIQRKNALLEDYDRAKSEFVAIVAHDFRKPLMAIRGFAEMVLEEPDLPAEARSEFMRTVVEETEHLAALANDTLLITRIETGQLEYNFSDVDLGPFLLDCVPMGLSNHSVLLDVPADFPRIVADADRLRQVIGNLTSNAVKYSPEGGSIIVRGRPRGGDHVLIEVIDHGLGIPEDQIDRLFNKFVRVRNDAHLSVSGTGLGLYIARMIVEGHAGRIWVESEPGRGSTFGLVLPLDARRATARAARAAAKAAAS